jgi:PPK2 family polyphosphate:nucleotide phosphotransferase
MLTLKERNAGIMINLEKEPTEPKEKITRSKAEKKTEDFKAELFNLQNLLYAEHKRSLLIILQGMDASGKDGTVRHVFSSMNPMGINVKPFKVPTEEEMDYDFLRRVYLNTPAKGMIQIFNRSHYEEILVPSVHKTLSKERIEKRYSIINSFEENLKDNGTVILKFYLNISKKEQGRRLKKRLKDPQKKWKYDPADKREAISWDAYMKVYEKIFERCGPAIPWFIVPADHKWYRNYFIAKEIVNTLRTLKMKYPS